MAAKIDICAIWQYDFCQMAIMRAEEETRKLVVLLGGKKVFRGPVSDARDMRLALREGLAFGAFEALLKSLELRSSELAKLVGVAARTLARRKSSGRNLSSIESDRLYRIAHIALLASEVFGSLEKARQWLSRGNRALGGERPVTYLDTEIGMRQVEEVLLRISHGIYS